MKTVSGFSAVALGLLAQASLSIHSVPRTVDPHFASRIRLCIQAHDSGGSGTQNDSGQSVAEFLGPALREIDVHQVGDSFPGFPSVASHVRQLLSTRPMAFSRYSPWAEGTPLGVHGILGTLQYRNGSTGVIEIAGQHMYAQDSLAKTWWVRLEAVDVLP